MMERTARVSDIDMRWLETGSGFPVVLIHGIPTSPELWRHVVPQLEGCRVLAWEMVGYGESMAAGEGEDLSISKQADYLASWLNSLEIRQALLVGHDLGGGVTHILAVRQPDLVAGLVLTNTIGYDSWPIPSVKAMRAARGAIRHLPPKAVAGFLRSFFYRGHDDRSMAAESADIHLRRYERNGGPAALARQVAALNVNDTLAVQDRISQIQVPGAVVWGEADQFQKIRYGERFARDLKAPLHRIPGGKHFTPEDHPRDLAAAIREILEQMPREEH